MEHKMICFLGAMVLLTAALTACAVTQPIPGDQMDLYMEALEAGETFPFSPDIYSAYLFSVVSYDPGDGSVLVDTLSDEGGDLYSLSLENFQPESTTGRPTSLEELEPGVRLYALISSGGIETAPADPDVRSVFLPYQVCGVALDDREPEGSLEDQLKSFPIPEAMLPPYEPMTLYVYSYDPDRNELYTGMQPQSGLEILLPVSESSFRTESLTGIPVSLDDISPGDRLFALAREFHVGTAVYKDVYAVILDDRPLAALEDRGSAVAPASSSE